MFFSVNLFSTRCCLTMKPIKPPSCGFCVCDPLCVFLCFSFYIFLWVHVCHVYFFFSTSAKSDRIIFSNLSNFKRASECACWHPCFLLRSIFIFFCKKTQIKNRTIFAYLFFIEIVLFIEPIHFKAFKKNILYSIYYEFLWIWRNILFICI